MVILSNTPINCTIYVVLLEMVLGSDIFLTLNTTQHECGCMISSTRCIKKAKMPKASFGFYKNHLDCHHYYIVHHVAPPNCSLIPGNQSISFLPGRSLTEMTLFWITGTLMVIWSACSPIRMLNSWCLRAEEVPLRSTFSLGSCTSLRKMTWVSTTLVQEQMLLKNSRSNVSAIQISLSAGTFLQYVFEVSLKWVNFTNNYLLV